MNDDIRGRLEEAGRRPAPQPDPTFADALEARLRAVATAAPPAEPPRRPGGARLRLALGGALLAGATGLAIILAVAAGTGRPVVAPELTAPVNVEVALSDGTVLEDPDGLRLPEGAVVRVGAGGSARIGDTVLFPGDVATVEQGRLNVEHDQPVGAVPGATRAPSPRPAVTPTPRATPDPTRTPRRTPAPSARPTQSAPTPAPSPTAQASSRPTRTPVPTARPGTPAPARTVAPPPPTARPAIARPRLRARVLFAPTRIRVTWTATPGAASYVLVTSRSRTGHAARPRYPGGRILGEFSRPPAAPLRLRVPNGVIEVKLMVVALGADGTVLARSRVAILATAQAATVPAATVPAATGPAATVPAATPQPTPTPTAAVGD